MPKIMIMGRMAVVFLIIRRSSCFRVNEKFNWLFCKIIYPLCQHKSWRPSIFLKRTFVAYRMRSRACRAPASQAPKRKTR